jgi:hypothetical protein
LTRAQQIEPYPLWRRSGRAVRDDREVRDVVKRDRSKVSNHVQERWLRSGAQSSLSFIGACINPGAVRGQLRRTRATFGLAALHAIHRCSICEPACRAKLDNQNNDTGRPFPISYRQPAGAGAAISPPCNQSPFSSELTCRCESNISGAYPPIGAPPPRLPDEGPRWRASSSRVCAVLCSLINQWTKPLIPTNTSSER